MSNREREGYIRAVSGTTEPPVACDPDMVSVFLVWDSRCEFGLWNVMVDVGIESSGDGGIYRYQDRAVDVASH